MATFTQQKPEYHNKDSSSQHIVLVMQRTHNQSNNSCNSGNLHNAHITRITAHTAWHNFFNPNAIHINMQLPQLTKCTQQNPHNQPNYTTNTTHTVKKNYCAYKCDMTSWDFTFLCIYKFKGQWVYYPPSAFRGTAAGKSLKKIYLQCPPNILSHPSAQSN